MCQLKMTTVGSKTFKVADIKEKYIGIVIDAANSVQGIIN